MRTARYHAAARATWALATVALVAAAVYLLVGPAAVGWWVLAVGPLYLIGHLLRGLRLFLLLYDGRVMVGQVLLAHLHAAAVSRLIPFKLGEAYRIAVVDGVIRSPVRALLTVWAERVFDIAVVASGVIVLTALARSPTEGRDWFLILVALFLALSFVVLLVLPESLVLLNRYLITRHNSPRVVRLLASLARVQANLGMTARVIRARWASALSLTLCLWVIEGLCLALTLNALDLWGFQQASDAFFAVASGSWWVLDRIEAGDPGGAYAVATAAALIIAGVVASLLTAWRLGRRGPAISMTS